MIDTDDYEGHTSGPWRAEGRDIHAEADWSSGIGDKIYASKRHGNEANAQLIAAAPDLLAFYLRIKEIMDMEEIEEIVRVELIWTVMQGMEE